MASETAWGAKNVNISELQYEWLSVFKAIHKIHGLPYLPPWAQACLPSLGTGGN